MLNEASQRGLTQWVQRYKFNVISYSALALSLLYVWHFFSDNDFSFLLTLGSALTTFAFVVLVMRLQTSKGTSGLSLKTLQAYAFVFLGRLASILFYEGYLPYDRSGDFFYRATEVMSFVCVIYLIYAMFQETDATRRSTYNPNVDCFGNYPPVPNKLGAVWLLAPTLLLAMILHPSLNGNFLTDSSWTWSLYLEAVAILPQLYLFQKRGGGSVDEFLANSIFALAFARLLHLIFWLSSFRELNDVHQQHFSAQYPGHLVMLSQVVQLLLMSDFIRRFLQSARHGKPMTILPV